MDHKKINCLPLLVVLFFILPAAQSQEKGDEPPNDPNIKLAGQLAEKIMDGMKSGNIYLLNEQQATPATVKGLNRQTQLAVYKQISDEFGEYKHLTFVESIPVGEAEPYMMYRFRGTFSKAKQGPEIRVVISDDRKLAGFWIIPWKDEIGGNP